jgi:hypothetical protein
VQTAAASYVVAVTRWDQPLAVEAEALASALGRPADELRKRLSGPLPVVVFSTGSAEHASRIRALLRDRGHGAVSCDLAKVTPSHEMVSPQDFELGPTCFVGIDRERGRSELAYDAIVALIWARHSVTTVATTTTTKRNFDMARAALSGGLVMSRKTTQKRSAEIEDREGVVYVFNRSGTDHVLLRENGLRYGGLGAQKASTRLENWKRTVDALRSRATGAVFDARLATTPPRATTGGAAQAGEGGPVLASNVEACDLAAHLITIARLQGQA